MGHRHITDRHTLYTTCTDELYFQFQFNLQTVDTQSYFVLILEIKKNDRKIQQGAERREF